MSKQGKHFKYRSLEFWAEAGMVCIQDQRYNPSHEKAFKVVMVRDFLRNMQSMSGEIKRHKYADEREEMLSMLDDGLKCCKEAKAQGRPDDPKALADMLKFRRKNMLHYEPSLGVAGALPAGIAPESAFLPPIPAPPDFNKSVIPPTIELG